MVIPDFPQYALAALMTAVATVIAVGLDRNMAIPNLSLIYFIPVVITAAIHIWGAKRLIGCRLQQLRQ